MLRLFQWTVSIHASAWEATVSLSVFQSTPPHGRRRFAMLGRRRCPTRSRVFQSTPPHGRRRGTTVWFQSTPPHRPDARFQSTSWEAFQSTPPHGRRRAPGFNPRLRMGGRPLRFQSTPPHGRRLGTRHTYDAIVHVSIHASAWEGLQREKRGQFHCFNPRLRMGGDIRRTPHCPRWCVSIHASAWEATRGCIQCVSCSQFQSTPPHGRRPGFRLFTNRRRRFQSTPPHGRRRDEDIYRDRPSRFQSTPPHGRRPPARRSTLYRYCFNPRLRMGGDPPRCSMK